MLLACDEKVGGVCSNEANGNRTEKEDRKGEEQVE